MEEILKEIEKTFGEFMKNAKVTGNKAAAGPIRIPGKSCSAAA